MRCATPSRSPSTALRRKSLKPVAPSIDFEATFAAQAKATKITEEFQKWIFDDEVRREELVAEFNKRFNSLVAPKHRGDKLTFRGAVRPVRTALLSTRRRCEDNRGTDCAP